MRMIRPMDYNFTGRILEKNDTGVTSFTNKVYEWEDIGELKGFIYFVTGIKRTVFGKESSENTHKIIINRDERIKESQRIKIDDREYEILYINDIDRKSKQITIDLKVVI